MAERPPTGLPDTPDQDLGFGTVVSLESRQRLLNRDGTFNVRRDGLGFFASHSAYHFLLTISWPRFLLLTAGAFLLLNAGFGLLYLGLGGDAFSGLPAGQPLFQRFLALFFFSVHTSATIGYGNVAPANLAANFAVVLEALVSLIGASVTAGVVFARVSRPTAAIIFSERAVVAPFREGRALMLRIANGRDDQIEDVGARIVFAQRRIDGRPGRDYFTLPLERDRVAMLPLTWTIVHAIDDRSPLRDLTPEWLRLVDGEFLVLLEAFGETFSQMVHVRTSYQADEVVFGKKFKDIFQHDAPDGILRADLQRIHELEDAT
jgi:inward rectifier potassium channel